MNQWTRIRGMNKSAWRAFCEGRGSGWVYVPRAIVVQASPKTIQIPWQEDFTEWTVKFKAGETNTGPVTS